MIIDTNQRTTSKLGCLGAAGVRTIIRYYARTTHQPEKRVTRAEAEAIIAAGMSIAIVHQAAGDSPSAFSRSKGLLDAAYAVEYAKTVIGQPEGSAIYFGVDYDASPAHIDDRIVPYFEAVNEKLSAAGYHVGVYGNGIVCKALLDAELVTFTWLSQSTGHQGSVSFKQSGRWTLFQHLSSQLCVLGIDKNDINPNANGFGDFHSLDQPGHAHAMIHSLSEGAAFDEAAFNAFVNGLGLSHFKPYELLAMGAKHANPHSPCHGLNTLPPAELWPNIGSTIRQLDSLRARLGAPIRLLSLYRSPSYNTCIGGAGESQHMHFNAIDFMAEGMSRPVDWARTLRSMRDDEQLFQGGVGLYGSFVHVDTRGSNADWGG